MSGMERNLPKQARQLRDIIGLSEEEEKHIPLCRDTATCNLWMYFLKSVRWHTLPNSYTVLTINSSLKLNKERVKLLF